MASQWDAIGFRGISETAEEYGIGLLRSDHLTGSEARRGVAVL